MRVLFFVAEYHRFSGAQISLLHLIKHLASDGIESLVLFPGEGVCVDRYREAGIEVEVLAANEKLNQFGASSLNRTIVNQLLTFGPAICRYSLAIARVMQKRKMDLLHCNTLRAVLLAALWPRLLGYPVIWHVRGLLSMNRKLVALGARLSSEIILVANALLNEFEPDTRIKCTTVHDAVHIEEVDRLGAASDNDLQAISTSQPVVATMAAIAPFKGLHHLIEAARLVSSDRNPKPLFLILGGVYDQDYATHLMQLVDAYKLNNVRFMGWKNNPFPYYKRAQMVVLPTVRNEQLKMNGVSNLVIGREGLPFSILEAMASRTPVVSTDVAGIPEQIVEGETGFVVKQADPQSLAHAIVTLLEDPQRAIQMGLNARAHVEEHFNCSLLVRKTMHVYEGLLGPGR